MKRNKHIAIAIIFTLICSLLPFAKTSAYELIKQYEVVENSLFYTMEGEEAGKLNKGLVIEAVDEDVNDPYITFKMNNSDYLAKKEFFTIKEVSEHEVVDEEAELEIIGKFVTSDSTSLYKLVDEEQGSIETGSLLPGKTYTFVKENETQLEMIVGSQTLFVKKEEVSSIAPVTSAESVDNSNIHEDASSEETTEPAVTIEKEETQEDESLEETTEPAVTTEKEETQEEEPEQQKLVLMSTFSQNDKYFKVLEVTPVYIKQNDRLVRVGKLLPGEEYPRIRDYGANWHEVKFNNSVAYVKKAMTAPSNGLSIKNKNNGEKFLTRNVVPKEDIAVYDNSSGSLVSFATLYKGINYQIISDYGSWYKISVLDRIGFIRKSDVSEDFSPSVKYFKVTDATAIYIKQNNKLVRVGRLSVGEVYPRIRDYGPNWHEIKFGNSVAYVDKQFTQPSDGKVIKNLITNYKNTSIFFSPKENIAVYENRGGKLVPFAGIYTNASYPVLADYGNWYKVVVSDRLGYVRKQDTVSQFTSNIRLLEATINTAIYVKQGGELKSVGFLKEGATVQRIRDYGPNWHEIEYGTGVGYVRKNYTIPSSKKIVNTSTNVKNSKTFFKAKVNSAVYHNDNGSLVSFASINANETYPIVSDYGSWYKVKLSGREGYIKKNTVTILRKDLVDPIQVYSYKEMEQDIISLAAMYPSIIQTKTIGKSVDGRNIYALKLGTGSTEILVNGSHHAREHITTNLVMEMIDEYAQGYYSNLSVDGYNVNQILKNTSIWFVPMVNPDGVTLVQEGHKSAKNPSYVLSINGGNKDFSAWKANVRGVDLNRQYPADWNNICCNPGKPGPQNYKGTKPLSEPEAKAMYNFTLDNSFKTSISYHTSGEIIYWNFHQKGSDYNRDYKLAQKLSKKTGYSLVPPKSNPSGGGFNDWFLISQKQPGFTPELSPYVGPRPVPIKNFGDIWKENNSVGLMMAYEAYIRTK
ncbi:M14 family metallocarboxypeptidase [Metabacillus halosaccharovorans]|uniref:M14 family metallocarboxypeptidase n=1 Tax=Metabacillus halosaccharovorans TaxID=930124 RepID=A0ABT3DCQ9_9BACI|nr:M14 family metallocarboxypeptidase [Metabacillus halosaccharovorans]MCV9884747.1 M14 family metallocarboxypeptidase [Metabacillus halosaccharovorans]